MDWEPPDRHWIRLRGPWEVCWLGEGTPHPPDRVKLPAAWSEVFGRRAGTARFVRRFQAPTGLDHDERVCITLLEFEGDARCSVNDTTVEPLAVPLGDPGCWPHERCLSFDITGLLQPSNQLTLDITVEDADAPNAGLHQPVLLEIITPDEDDAAG